MESSSAKFRKWQTNSEPIHRACDSRHTQIRPPTLPVANVSGQAAHRGKFEPVYLKGKGRLMNLSQEALALACAAALAGCTTGPIMSTDLNPPGYSWTFAEQSPPNNAPQTVTSGFDPTPPGTVISPGVDYLVVYHATSNAGLKSIAMTANLTVACSGRGGPYTISNPYNVTIPLQPITFAPLPSQQAYTDAFYPYYFSWANGPAAIAYNACAKAGSAFLPLIGSTTYGGSATTVNGVPNATSYVRLRVPPP
jgi:hypothetical protein